MRVLILGGTKYLGRHLAEHALRAGHDVTLFNRGRTGTELFPGVPRLIGDRTADGDPAGLTALGTGTWDTVFDFSGFYPRQVAATAGLLAPRIGQYVFMSSIAVYPQSAEAAMPGRATAVRAGLISGPGDPFGAFTSWALAMAGAGVVPCAARASQPVQVTDVRDLAAFLLRIGPGPFNVMPPPMIFAQMLDTCRQAGGGTATVKWTQDENVDDLGGFIVQPRDGSEDGVFQLSGERARLAGYRPRPFAETARDTIEWALRTKATFTNPH